MYQPVVLIETPEITAPVTTSKAEMIVYGVTVGAVVLSLVLAVFVLNMPDKQNKRVVEY